MRSPKHDPETADDLAQAEPSPYTVEGFRTEIRSLSRKLARIRNLARLADTFCTDKRVKDILREALEIK